MNERSHGMILQIAERCRSVDADELARALDSGEARGALMADHRDGLRFVQGSPHLFLADGFGMHNPGIDVSWTGDQGTG